MSYQAHHRPIDSPGDLTREGIELLKHVAITMAEASKHFHTRQIEAAQASFAENTRQFKSQLKETGNTCAALEQWSALLQAKMQQCAQINGAWIENTSQTIAAMSELLASPLVASGTSVQKTDDPDLSTPLERRVSATVIAFPERRAAEIAKNSVKNNVRLAKKRHSA